MVVLNRIYTRTGDDGTTALGSGERRPKYDLRIGAYGTVDETNAAIGIVRLHLADARELDAMLGLIQNDLFDLGADLAVPEREGKAERLRILSSQVERLEHDIDAHDMSQGGADDGGTRGPAQRAGQRCGDPVYEPVV
jgi:cob(I)alamin adenosyltransferase